MQLGILSFAEMTPDPKTGVTIMADERLAQVIEEAELADQLGLDVFGIGEHHRHDFAGSAPAVILAAIAAKTKTIRLTTAVTVLSADDPVRVFQQFTTLDLISKGRAEIMVGRGVFTEPFVLFGQNLEAYDEIFGEKLDLLLKLRDQERIDWTGKHRAGLQNQKIYPRPQRRIPIWVGVGGTQQSAIRAGQLGLPMTIGIVGGNPANFAPLAKLHRDAAAMAGHDLATTPLGLNMHAFLADSAAEAAEIFFPTYMQFMNGIGRERGWPPISRAHCDALIRPEGSMLLGSPEEVANKIIAQHKIFRHQRCTLQLSVGTTPHDKVLRAIELLGTKVAPMVREALSSGFG
jgi:probable LLM family oxidoreductase